MPSRCSPAAAHNSFALDSSDPVIDNLTPSQLESLLHFTLKECNRLSKANEVITREVAMAKMVNHCIRMLHSNGWIPGTVVRAMVHMEAGTERSVKGVMFQSLREKRDEGRMRRAAKEDAGVFENVDEGEVKVVKSDCGSVTAVDDSAGSCSGCVESGRGSEGCVGIVHDKSLRGSEVVEVVDQKESKIGTETN